MLFAYPCDCRLWDESANDGKLQNSGYCNRLLGPIPALKKKLYTHVIMMKAMCALPLLEEAGKMAMMAVPQAKVLFHKNRPNCQLTRLYCAIEKDNMLTADAMPLLMIRGHLLPSLSTKRTHASSPAKAMILLKPWNSKVLSVEKPTLAKICGL